MSQPRQLSRRSVTANQTRFVWVRWFTSCRCGIRSASPKKSRLLDNLTEGRLECGFGAGIGPFSFAAYNIPWEQKREMTLEALQIIRGIWTHESFSFEGRYFKCKDIDSSIPLVQKPHPPLWMPTRSKDSIEEAASSAISTIQWVPARDESRAHAPSTNTAKFIDAPSPPGLNRISA